MTSRSITKSPAELTIAELAADITQQMLQARRIYLKKREPRTVYQRDVRAGVSCGRSTPIEKCLTISLADLEDGAPIAAVVACYESIIELLNARAREIEGAGVDAPDLLPIIERENRFETAENVAERRLIANQNDVAAIDAVLDTSVQEHVAQDSRDAALRRRRGVLLNRQLQPSSPRERVSA